MTAPPRFLERLLERLLPDRHRDAVLGDLAEDFARRPSRLRYARQALSALLLVPPPLAMRRRARHQEARMASIAADLRLALRLLRRAPAFAIICVLTLGLAIGAATALYSVARPLLLEPLPYPDPERLVTLADRGADGSASNTGWATYADVAREARSLEHVAVMGHWVPTLSGNGESAERLTGLRVSWQFFRTLGVQPALGRDFLVEEDAVGRNGVVVISDGLWRRRFGADPGIVGRTVALDDREHVVVGVMPPSFEYVMSPSTQVWRVLGYDATQPWACRTCRHLQMIGRLRPGVSLERSVGELETLSRELMRRNPNEYPAAGFVAASLADRAVESIRAPLVAVLGAVFLVLLIAIANVANLQLARAMRRQGEFAVRQALGAGRGRLVQQQLAEALVIAALGGVLGTLVAFATLPALVNLLPAEIPRLQEVRVEGAALLVALAASLGSALVIGLVPAWRGDRHVADAGLRSGARLVQPGHRVARAGLVVGEVALAMVLLVGAGLLARSLTRLLAEDAGFEVAGLLTLELQSTGAAYREDAGVYAYHDRVLDAVRSLPGVESAALASQLPLGGNMDMYSVNALDKPLANPELAPYADRYVVTPGFTRTMRIGLVRGRAFDAMDARDSAARVAMVSASLAAVVWPGENSVGKQIRMGDSTAPWRTVVGVVRDVRHSGLDATVTRQVYVPERQWEWADNQPVLVVRARKDAAAIASAVRDAVRAVDPTQPIARVATMTQVVAASTAQRRLALGLFAAFALAALLLSSAGIYGVLAGSVTERTREIGLRSALGAAPRAILALVMRQALGLAAFGLLLGLAGAAALSRFLRALLYEVEPADPLTLGSVALVLAAVALLACLVPALRAVRIDPMRALRSE
jgi:putative ABC transport system permease protein